MKSSLYDSYTAYPYVNTIKASRSEPLIMYDAVNSTTNPTIIRIIYGKNFVPKRRTD